jgi:hypothetical protein
MPADLPETVSIFRGVKGCFPAQAAHGLSWTLDFDCAAWFAEIYADRSATRRDGSGYVLAATVPRASLVAYFNDRSEKEVIPDAPPRDYRVISDAALISPAAERREREQRREQSERLRRAKQMAHSAPGS